MKFFLWELSKFHTFPGVKLSLVCMNAIPAKSQIQLFRWRVFDQLRSVFCGLICIEICGGICIEICGVYVIIKVFFLALDKTFPRRREYGEGVVKNP
ncbi:MAG: hypothetical protein EBT07_09565 [Actinobacteria bacterium]|nr:hypothetical protein [Actinomycetota bacterium]